MVDDIGLAMASVERWLGNPLARAMLGFVTAEDECGSRLSNAIDLYLGEEKDVCWRCRLASRIVGRTLHTGSDVFDVDEEAIRNGLRNPVWRRGLMNVLTGIARYGVTRPQIVNAPFLVVWDLTHACNLRCRHCYQDAQRPLPAELSTDEGKGLIDQLSAAGVVVLAFSGGEPLMRKDFFELAAYARKREMYVALASNGTMITPEVAARLAATGIEYVEVSIDGEDAAHHDAMRGIPGAFDRATAGISACVDAGLYTCIATTVTSANIDQVPAIYDLARDLGVHRLMCFNFIPTGRGVEMAAQDIAPCQRDDLLRMVLERDRAGVIPDILSTAPQFARIAVEAEAGVPVGHFYPGQELSGRTRMLADFIGGCGAGRIYCSIEPEGEVQPCVFLPISLGNVRDRPFLEIWHSSSVLDQLRDRSRLKSHCGECENHLVCGGCRARAWAYFQDLAAPDPGCVRNGAAWQALCEAALVGEASAAPEPGVPAPVSPAAR
jgi:radical SAM protein with 4Fe4S-binding SPASM domain